MQMTATATVGASFARRATRGNSGGALVLASSPGGFDAIQEGAIEYHAFRATPH